MLWSLIWMYEKLFYKIELTKINRNMFLWRLKIYKKYFFFQCFVALFALVAVAAAAPQYAIPAPAYAPAPVYAPAPAYGAEPAYPDTVPSYNYNYGVTDGYSGANFGAAEAREGYNTNGEYHVALPDGRTQTVTYTADGNGYIADVKYTGEAVYAAAPAPAYAPAPAPAYAPAPVRAYAPAPVIVPAAPIYRPAPAPYRPAPYRPAIIA